VSVLLGAITALTLGGTPGLVTYRDVGGVSGGARPFTTAFTRLGTGGTSARLYGNFQKNQAPAAGRTYTTDFTRLAPTGSTGQVYGSFAGKFSTNVADFVVADSIRVYVNESPFSQIDFDLQEILTPRVTESRGVVSATRSASDNLIPRVTDAIQFLQKSGSTTKVGADTVTAVVAETVSVSSQISGSDTILPVVTDAVTSVEKPAVVVVNDDIIVVLSDTKFLETAGAQRAFFGTDDLTPLLVETAIVSLSGEVDIITITARPHGRIRITKI